MHTNSQSETNISTFSLRIDFEHALTLACVVENSIMMRSYFADNFTVLKLCIFFRVQSLVSFTNASSKSSGVIIHYHQSFAYIFRICSSGLFELAVKLWLTTRILMIYAEVTWKVLMSRLWGICFQTVLGCKWRRRPNCNENVCEIMIDSLIDFWGFIWHQLIWLSCPRRHFLHVNIVLFSAEH